METTWTELDLGVVRENIAHVKNILGEETRLILVVKADSYGHGAVPISRCAAECGIDWFAVAHVREGVAVREAVPDANILMVGAMSSRDAKTVVDNRITPILASEDHAMAVGAEVRALGTEIECHAKIDSGMGRLGFLWETAEDAIARVVDAGGLKISGMCMHFASAAGTADSFADQQWERFQKVVAGCEERGISIPFKHIANSAAFLTRPEWDLDAVRLGITVYGYGTSRDGVRVRTTPCLQWKARLAHVKKVPAGFRVGYYSTHVTEAPTTLATLDVGYADGYKRLLSNCGEVIIGGKRCPIVGRVTMNFIIVDLGPDSTAARDDEAVLVGSQGDESLWADELAHACRTIPYEILTSIRTDDRRVIGGDANDQ